jgi:hypothetical protein
MKTAPKSRHEVLLRGGVRLLRARSRMARGFRVRDMPVLKVTTLARPLTAINKYILKYSSGLGTLQDDAEAVR